MSARRIHVSAFLIVATIVWATMTIRVTRAAPPEPEFRTSDRCLACHNGLTTASGQDVSIGFDWRAAIMANSSRDPYWQASVRRETVDHTSAKAAIEDECSVCHMPITRYDAKVRGKYGEVFTHLPFHADEKEGRAAADGVSCSVCHQISTERLGTPESYNGGFVVQPPQDAELRPEYGPFVVEAGHTRIMRSSTEGYRPTQSDHIRQSEICATCHTLMTQALGPDGAVVGRLPEQVPYQEWQHSEFKATKSCQACHMPAVNEPAPITRVFGVPRDGVSRHVFVAGNFFVLRMLNRYRDALDVAALPQELTAGADRTIDFLASQAASLRIDDVQVEGGRLRADVVVENLSGHKLPTAYPSRRAWLHLVVRDANARVVFESGALNPDGSVQGNDNDADASAFEPHYTEIRSADQVQIYESVLGDTKGAITTGLLTAVRYLKDNRLLPRGFDKRTAEPDIAVQGSALDDPDFVGGSDRVRYSVTVAGAQGPFVVNAELLYQPIGFRWANNLKAYGSHEEPRRFTGYYDAMASGSATVLARAEVSRR
jgi:cytochrome c551/c552